MDSSVLLAKAITLSAIKHANQYDKGGMPYALHPAKVAYLLKTDDLELMAIAYCHDLIEDTDVTADDMYALGFTARVVTAVQLLTKYPNQTHEEYMTAIKSSKDAIRVKLADLRHNSDIRRLKRIRDKDVERMKKYHSMHLELRDLA